MSTTRTVESKNFIHTCRLFLFYFFFQRVSVLRPSYSRSPFWGYRRCCFQMQADPGHPFEAHVSSSNQRGLRSPLSLRKRQIYMRVEIRRREGPNSPFGGRIHQNLLQESGGQHHQVPRYHSKVPELQTGLSKVMCPRLRSRCLGQGKETDTTFPGRTPI